MNMLEEAFDPCDGMDDHKQNLPKCKVFEQIKKNIFENFESKSVPCADNRVSKYISMNHQ